LVAYGGSDTLQDAWAEHMDTIRPSLERDPAACDGGTAGVRRWGFGRLACGVEDGSAVISWTDSRSHLLGTARGVGPDIGELYAWWQEDAKPLGRTTDSGRSPSTTPTDPPADRVREAQSDVLCTSMDEPIVDSHGRTWRIERVRFLDRPDHERVVFVLSRVDSKGQGAEVTVDRMPVADVASEVPGAQRPGRGRTALVVRMPGVTRSPDLQTYRPRGLAQVRELSLARGPRSRTAILSLNGDACYQMQVPVFGPSATGREDRAEIVIDIPR
jgi:hypothetical protein